MTDEATDTEYRMNDSSIAVTNGVMRHVNRLSVADMPFASTGVAHVRVTKQGKATLLPIPIKSVEFEQIEALCAGDRPRIPRKREHIAGKWQFIADETDQEYLLHVGNYNRKLSYLAVLMGIDVDICDATGKVVWSADNTTCEYEAARSALRQMGLVENQFIDILTAIRQLTKEDEEQADQD